MFIEEVTLEGFKSYAQRVVVPRFDPGFNAITGLNGTGKSNILDSICFVLGITNLSQVRASNLQELVYKQGQAGVTKATVSITFNNDDKAVSPVGYEDYDKITVTRQVVIGGRNKYLINGSVAQPARVQNLFHSVQLNVNNPHFLIMQGRITKVLNMKPVEILSMLEEAAGTRMYETKKEAALKTLAKKQSKVDEIDNILAEEILPALEKLRRERSEYQSWAMANNSIERLRRFCIAYEYARALKIFADGTNEIDHVKARVKELREDKLSLEASIAAKDDEAKQLEEERAKQSENGELKALAAKVDTLSKNLVKSQSGVSNKQEALDAERKSCESLAASVAELEAASSGADGDSDRIAEELARCKEAKADAERLIAEAENEIAGCADGGDGRDGSGRSFKERLIEAQEKRRAYESEKKELGTKVSLLKKELAAKQKEQAAKAKGGETDDSLMKGLEKARKDADGAKAKLASLAFDEGAATELTEKRKNIAAETKKYQAQIAQVESTLAHLDVFKTGNGVKGAVAKLVHVSPLNLAKTHSTALEVAAGGKLFQCVVDTAATAKSLLTNSKTKQRVTIIPLDKIRAPSTFPEDKKKAMKALAGSGSEFATPAIEFVGYEDDVKRAVQYAFGNTVVCSSKEVAQKVAFDKNVRQVCVTLEGDKFDPSGLLTGGSRKAASNGPSLLQKVSALHGLSVKLGELKADLANAEAGLKKHSGAQAAYDECQRAVEQHESTFQLLEQKLKNSKEHQLVATIAALSRDLETAQARDAELTQLLKDIKEEIASVEKAMADFGKNRKSLQKAAEKKLADATKAAKAAEKELTKAEKKSEDAAIARATAAQEKEVVSAQVEESKATQESLAKELSDLQKGIESLEQELETARDELATLRSDLTASEETLKAIAKERQAMIKQTQSCTAESKKLENKLAKLEKEHKHADATVENLTSTYPWIQGEEHLFGVAGGDYDFDAQDPREAQRELDDAVKTHESLSKKINKKVMSMFDRMESEYKELMDKKRIVTNDKSKIESVISELDEKKRQALMKTWRKVNTDFASIFSMLLPGTTARLSPPRDTSGDGDLDEEELAERNMPISPDDDVEATFLVNGLEVKVSFDAGATYKESLSELSGGQRSLLALSLILSLLLFKPAPLYILDEVDAALDLSHTQNIGKMIKTHFPQSQFVVVSLKEGMFSNANVIYRTKFVDGISQVVRTENASAALTQRNQKAALPAPKGKGKGKVSVDAEEEDVDDQQENTAPRKRARGNTAVA